MTTPVAGSPIGDQETPGVAIHRATRCKSRLHARCKQCNTGHHVAKQCNRTTTDTYRLTKNQQNSSGTHERGAKFTPPLDREHCDLGGALSGSRHANAKYCKTLPRTITEDSIAAQEDTFRAQGAKPIPDVNDQNRIFESFAEAFHEPALAQRALVDEKASPAAKTPGRPGVIPVDLESDSECDEM